ncbi:MAG: hypothetical protein E7643_02750 [Ruminococcaceae bacterium]|nr:hypothetical protein [Oscillospiraceae bacterium]
MEQTNVPAKEPLAALLSNPELLRTVGGLLGGMSGNPKPSTSAPENGTEEAAPAPPPSFDGLAQLLSNRELMEKLPTLLSSLIGTASASKPTATPTKSEEDTVPASVLPSPKAIGTCRNDLLLALKPFLSKERCEAVDMIIRLSALGSVLGRLR